MGVGQGRGEVLIRCPQPACCLRSPAGSMYFLFEDPCSKVHSRYGFLGASVLDVETSFWRYMDVRCYYTSMRLMSR